MEYIPKTPADPVCSGENRGVTRFGKAWMIPKNAEKPADGRTKAGSLRYAKQ